MMIIQSRLPGWVAWPRGYKTFSMLNSAENEIYPADNVKMPTIVGIFKFISMINTTSERLKARNFFIRRYFSLCGQLKFHAQLSCEPKKFYNLGPGLCLCCWHATKSGGAIYCFEMNFSKQF